MRIRAGVEYEKLGKAGPGTNATSPLLKKAFRLLGLKSQRSQVVEVGSAMGYLSLMPLFTEMPPGLAEMLIEDAEDEISPAMRDALGKIAAHSCPRCQGSMAPKLHEKAPFGSQPLPRMLAECRDCGCTVSIDSGLVVSNGNLARVNEVLPLIEPDD